MQLDNDLLLWVFILLLVLVFINIPSEIQTSINIAIGLLVLYCLYYDHNPYTLFTRILVKKQPKDTSVESPKQDPEQTPFIPSTMEENLNDLYAEHNQSADDAMTERGIYTQRQAKQSEINFAKNNSRTLEKFFRNELDQNEKREWWDDTEGMM